MDSTEQCPILDNEVRCLNQSNKEFLITWNSRGGEPLKLHKAFICAKHHEVLVEYRRRASAGKMRS